VLTSAPVKKTWVLCFKTSSRLFRGFGMQRARPWGLPKRKKEKEGENYHYPNPTPASAPPNFPCPPRPGLTLPAMFSSLCTPLSLLNPLNPHVLYLLYLLRQVDEGTPEAASPDVPAPPDCHQTPQAQETYLRQCSRVKHSMIA